MKKLETNITMEAIQAIIAEEKQKAKIDKFYKPMVNLVLVEDTKLTPSSAEQDHIFRNEHLDEIEEFEEKTEELFKNYGIGYDEFFDSDDAQWGYRHYIEKGNTFDDLHAGIEEFLKNDDWGYPFFTFTAIQKMFC